MRIAEFLRETWSPPTLPRRTRRVCSRAVRRPGPAYPSFSAQQLSDTLLEREKLGSTGIGEGVAIPHGKLPGLPGLLAAFGRKRAGVDFAAIDGKPTHLFFVLFAPDNSAGLHLKALARISRLFKQPQFRQAILNAEGPPGFSG